MDQEIIVESQILSTSDFFDLDLVTKFILMSNYAQLVQDDWLFKPMSSCKYCGLNNACIWREKRDDLMAYYLDCQRRNKGFGELGSVESTNRGARKVLHTNPAIHMFNVYAITLDFT